MTIGIMLAAALLVCLLIGSLSSADASPEDTVSTTASPTSSTTSLSSPSPLATSSPLSHAQPTASTSETPSASPAPTTSETPGKAGETGSKNVKARSASPHTVTFTDPLGASTSQSVNDKALATRPADPLHEGYLFDGWFIGSTSVAYDFSEPVTDNITLTAHWTKGSNTWGLRPRHGPSAGGATATLTPPADQGIRFSRVDAGDNLALAMGSDGNLYTWGDNSNGQLGRTTTDAHADRPGRVDSPNGIIFTQASGGRTHAVAIGSDGNLYTWGDNKYGQLGRDTSNTPSDRPGKVVPPAGVTFTRVSAGFRCSLAIGSDGNLYTWGDNKYGQLGRDTSNTPSGRPGKVVQPAGVTFTQADAGYSYSVAMGSDGNLYSWGNSNLLGRGINSTPADRPGKVEAPEGITFTQVVAGGWHSMAMGSDGNLYTWGNNSNDQLGRDTSKAPANRPGKVETPEGITLTRLVAGNTHSMAMGSDRSMYTWGDNSNDQLGRDTSKAPANRPGKVETPEGITLVPASAGYWFSQAMGSDGNLYNWGDSSYNVLGRDTTDTPNNLPGKVVFPGKPEITKIEFGEAPGVIQSVNPDGTRRVTTPKHTEGQVDVIVSWKRNGAQPDTHLPYLYDSDYTVTFDSAGGSDVAQRSVSVTKGRSVARPSAVPVRDGYLFDGWFTNTRVAYDFTQPVMGDLTLTAHWSPAATSVWKVDRDSGSEIGGETITLTPPATRGVHFSQVSAGDSHVLAVSSEGTLYTWGNGDSRGLLGRDTDNTPANKPGIVAPSADVSLIQASAGTYHSVAIGSDGNLYTWGENEDGQLGRDTSSTPANRPGKVEPPEGVTFIQASAGAYHTLALGSDGNLYTWGINGHDQLGRDTSSTPANRPGKVEPPEGVTFIQASAGTYHTLALGSDGNLYSWGDADGFGLLGRDTSSTPANRPGKVESPEGVTFIQASAGAYHTLALGSDGNVYTWGINNLDQLGRNFDSVPVDRPGKVDKPAGATFIQVGAGDYHSMALSNDGSIYTWGYNSYGQLGRDTAASRPGKVAPPEDVTFTLASAGDYDSMALGSDGNLYTWGLNDQNQLGRDTSSTPANKPGKVEFPGRAIPTSVRFDQNKAPTPTENPDGTWKTTIPRHEPGIVTITIDWTLNQTRQTPDTNNTYRYIHIGTLPLTGSNGILLMLAIGLLAATGAAASNRNHQETRNNRS
uniref:InlB B-repeat-containing protein n=1 Tax=Bifidobacterium asteroides TaxID=1684 RepID=A0ABS3IUF0_9BIFI